MKSKLKELAALCIDKEVVFHCNGSAGSLIYCAYVAVEGEIKYFGNASEIAADWKVDSIERLNEVISMVGKYNGANTDYVTDIRNHISPMTIVQGE